jgi:hypothetical protein
MLFHNHTPSGSLFYIILHIKPPLFFAPAVLFILLQFAKVAVKAQPVMAAYRSTAAGAAPFLLFLFQEFSHAMFFDELQIFYHAHMVFVAVSLIQSFQASAWELLALIAEPNKPFSKQIALFFQESAVLSPWQTAFTV